MGGGMKGEGPGFKSCLGCTPAHDGASLSSSSSWVKWGQNDTCLAVLLKDSVRALDESLAQCLALHCIYSQGHHFAFSVSSPQTEFDGYTGFFP